MSINWKKSSEALVIAIIATALAFLSGELIGWPDKGGILAPLAIGAISAVVALFIPHKATSEKG